MKKFAVLIVLIISSINIYAQENAETLFGGEDIKIGGYGGPEVKFTGINNEFGILVGGRGGILINSTFTIGLAGYGLVTSHLVEDYKLPVTRGTDSSAYLRMGYGGLHFGFNVEPNKVLHINAGVLIGAGGATYTTAFNDMDNNNSGNFKSYNNSTFFIAEPQIGAELNLLKFMRMELSASYRFISGIQLPKTENKDLSGFSGNLIFKFGKF
jgi:hypothetical protein